MQFTIYVFVLISLLPALKYFEIGASPYTLLAVVSELRRNHCQQGTHLPAKPI
jgi:hypothetical protein